MTATLWALVALIGLGFVIGWRLVKRAVQAERGRALESENEIRNQARRARQRLDHDERDRLRRKFKR